MRDFVEPGGDVRMGRGRTSGFARGEGSLRILGECLRGAFFVVVRSHWNRSLLQCSMASPKSQEFKSFASMIFVV